MFYVTYKQHKITVAFHCKAAGVTLINEQVKISKWSLHGMNKN